MGVKVDVSVGGVIDPFKHRREIPADWTGALPYGRSTRQDLVQVAQPSDLKPLSPATIVTFLWAWGRRCHWR